MKNIVFHAGGFGDLFVCFKALYATKCLYPDYKLILFIDGFQDKNFLKNISFLDEVFFFNDFCTDLKKLNPDIFISSERSSAFFKKLKSLNLKKVIVFPHFVSIMSSYFHTPRLFFRSKLHMSEVNLKLVKAIDEKHYEQNINKVNFSNLKSCLPYKSELSDMFFNKLGNKYEKIIAINPFANYSEFLGHNFFPRQWINLAQNLALTYPKYLFVLLNFKHNTLRINIDESKNLKSFVNDESIASLFHFSSKLDYLISIDTGQVHVCDILQVPSLVLIRKVVANRYANGSYASDGGGALLYDKFVLQDCWQKEYRKTYANFCKKAFAAINKL
ncbi:MAG TPA: hypothetical protein K8V51_01570 [Campylobacter avium]|uniref:glycosyltransferase family 9 protein n=2 Tax=Campylobacter avium TaxID=522485 RepID=UPI001D545BB8|nr:hypothetical protein [Campylobacter avium]HJE65736.1 hypothetical protein [Campylobacter avium]